MRICILHNPSAGHATDFRSVQQSLAMRDDLTLVEPTSPEALYEAVAEAAREGYDVIAAAGGDRAPRS
ncbi:MAG: hypothetical protein HKN04_13585 [Rhodothermaceae bacterium]|nr:hypothetical protein [Rhodothermaceae bacterium]